ncbi:MAG: hypothetical protein JWO13_2190 [Acidobacteriales bacterium]|nr:hypothetical protein [Terriglobales bacterium]
MREIEYFRVGFANAGHPLPTIDQFGPKRALWQMEKAHVSFANAGHLLLAAWVLRARHIAES